MNILVREKICLIHALKFFTYNQTNGQAIDEYVTELKSRSRHCEFGILKESLIRDRIVAGIQDANVRERLLRETDLSLDKAISICRASEATKKRRESRDSRNPTTQRPRQDRPEMTRNNDQSRASKYCGNMHQRGRCPAYGRMCNKCRKWNHFASVCQSKSVSNTEQEQSSSDERTEFFVGTVQGDEKDVTMPWTMQILTTGTNVSYKLDTGSQVNIIPQKTHHALQKIKRVEILNCDDTNFVPSQDVFGEIGCLHGEHHIQIEENATPVVHPPRRVPYALMDKLKTELDRMKQLDIIEEIDEPTEWVSSLVIIEKADGRLRVCLDPSDLNRVIKREYYPMPTAETVMSEMSEGKYFSKLDASNGYWQIKVDEESSKLLTFNTLFGRHRFIRLPFGILSASEVFQKKIAEIIQGLDGCTNVQDDILVWGSTKEQHDARLKAVMERIQQAGLKLNEKKCVFGSTEVVFLAHLFSHEGVKPDPTKIEAIRDMPTPKSKQDVDLQRLLGMITYLGKFIPNLSITTGPLRQLMESDVEWHWSNHHNAALDQIKKLLTESPTLKYYDPELPTRISVDASKFGLGAALLQKHGDTWAPVAYASRSLSKSEQNYAQIEKEALAILFGCERFHVYLYGKSFTVESDHKPLQPIFKKPICKAPPRIQRFRLRLQKYSITCT